jgi:SAM-dependent methyltransferase
MMAELLDLDAEVMHEHLTALMSWIGEQVTPRRILDLGSGTGTGSIALARQFPDAEVTALDASEYMLRRLTHRATGLGLAGRIHTVQADLDQPWPDVEPVDLVWASASLHHLADPDRVLADVFATLNPGGLFVVAEMVSFPRFLPDGTAGGVEERLHAIRDAARTHDMPHMGDDWGSRLSKAGFVVETARDQQITLTAPLPPATGRYAVATIGRMRDAFADRLSPADRTALETLLADLPAHPGLGVRTSRPLWTARRP